MVSRRREPPIATTIGTIASQYAQHGAARRANVNNGCYTSIRMTVRPRESHDTTQLRPKTNVFLIFIIYTTKEWKNGAVGWFAAGRCSSHGRRTTNVPVVSYEYTTLKNGSIGTPLRKWTSAYSRALMDAVQSGELAAYSSYIRQLFLCARRLVLRSFEKCPTIK